MKIHKGAVEGKSFFVLRRCRETVAAPAPGAAAPYMERVLSGCGAVSPLPGLAVLCAADNRPRDSPCPGAHQVAPSAAGKRGRAVVQAMPAGGGPHGQGDCPAWRPRRGGVPGPHGRGHP